MRNNIDLCGLGCRVPLFACFDNFSAVSNESTDACLESLPRSGTGQADHSCLHPFSFIGRAPSLKKHSHLLCHAPSLRRTLHPYSSLVFPLDHSFYHFMQTTIIGSSHKQSKQDADATRESARLRHEKEDLESVQSSDRQNVLYQA